MTSIEKAIEKLRREQESLNHSVSPEYRVSSVGVPEHVVKKAQPVETERRVTIDFNRLSALGMIVPNIQTSAIAEEYRHIKRPLLQNAFGSSSAIVDEGRKILVTSSVPGEGKTFTAINLAISIAMEIDKTVLLVDADLSMSGVSRTLGFDAGYGLADILLDKNIPLPQVLISTNIANLAVLSAGQPTSQKAELLSSDNMRRLVGELSQRYADRIIIFDAPPLMATSEARVLAGMVGQIVFVVEEGKTSQRLVQEAVSSLDQSKAIGFVLNKSTRSMLSSYGYYGSRGVDGQ